AEAALLVVRGGPGTLVGPIVGAGLIVAIRNLVSNYLERWPLVLGAIFMLTVVLAPNGLLGVLLVAPRNVVSNYLERWPLVLGAIFMLTVVLAPNGLVGWLLARRRRAAAAG